MGTQQAVRPAHNFEAGENITPEIITGLAEEAAIRLEGFAYKTPIVSSDVLSHGSAQVIVKDETQQPGGSFKDRGAGNAVFYHAEHGETMVITASAGNHGRGVARAAAERGMNATVVVPATASDEKRRGIERWRAELLVHGDNFNQALDYSLELAEQLSGPHVHPYATKIGMAGQATIARELLAQAPDMTHFVVPLGGGGLGAATGAVLKEYNKDIEVIGAQIVGNSAFVDSLQVGKPLNDQDIIGSFEGIAVGNVHPMTFNLGRQVIDRTVLVEPATVDRTTYDYWKEQGTLLERAGAVSPTAAQYLANTVLASENVKIVALATGANPPKALGKWLTARARRLGWDKTA